MKTRSTIESSILAAIIYDNGYAAIAHILSPVNFSSAPGSRNKEVYQVVCEMFPSRPIDIITFRFELKNYDSQFEEEVQETLFSLPEQACSASNIVYWAFILLQIDITEKFKNQCIIWKDHRQGGFEHVEAAALLEIIEHIDHKTDIFTIIEGAQGYFKSLNMEEEHSSSIKFYNDILQKVHNLKNMNSINTALRYLIQLVNATPDVQHHCTVLVNAISSMIINNKVTEEQEQAVKTLNR